MRRVFCFMVGAGLLAGCTSFNNENLERDPPLVFHAPIHRENAGTAHGAAGSVADDVPGALPPGFILSPYAPESGYVDVRGLESGTAARDPYTGRIFYVP